MNRSAEIIEQIEVLLGELKGSSGPKSSGVSASRLSGKMEPPTGFSGLSGQIYNLVEEGFFKEPKTISEIQEKLRLEGIRKPTTTLMAPLLHLIRKKALGRSKSTDGKGPFKYHQR